MSAKSSSRSSDGGHVQRTMKSRRRNAAWGAIGLFLLTPVQHSFAADPDNDPREAESQEALQPKYVWGMLVNVVIKLAMSMFTNWLISKLTVDLSSMPVLERLLANSKQAAIVPLSSVSPLQARSAGAPENTVAGEPTVPFKIDNGLENYQAVHVAIVGFDDSGRVTGLRPVSAGFRSGERFRLKVLPTFDGILVVENITPAGQRRQIFPPDVGTVVSVTRGLEVLVPMAQDYYFEFAGPVGDEQLVITVRDPRAFGAGASQAKASRKDDQYGSSFVQESQPGTHPLISQSLKLSHSK